MNKYIKESAIRKGIEELADMGKLRVDRMIYRHLDIMVFNEMERLTSINKGKRFAKKTIELCPEHSK